MRYSFRLAQLVNHDPDPKKRPGTIKAICAFTGLDRHLVASLLKNDAKYVPLDSLSRLCDFLVERGYADADELPGALFAVEPENFWELLARRGRVELCLGARRARDWPDGAWMRAGDSVLVGELLGGISTLGGTAKYTGDAGPDPSSSHATAPHLETLKQSLVWAPETEQPNDQRMQSRARDVYAQFAGLPGDRALVCLGSVKSNPVVDLVLGDSFSCEPWISQDDVKDAHQRTCPIFVRYRDEDPQPSACSGGMRLSKSQANCKPGIYYRKENGTWGHCPYDRERHDAALVFYMHRESQGRLEMVLGGFSGRATRLLAETLSTHAREFWPPNYQGHGLQMGAFLVRYTLTPADDPDLDILSAGPVASQKVIRLDESVLAHRIEPTAA